MHRGLQENLMTQWPESGETRWPSCSFRFSRIYHWDSFVVAIVTRVVERFGIGRMKREEIIGNALSIGRGTKYFALIFL